MFSKLAPNCGKTKPYHTLDDEEKSMIFCHNLGQQRTITFPITGQDDLNMRIEDCGCSSAVVCDLHFQKISEICCQGSSPLVRSNFLSFLGISSLDISYLAIAFHAIAFLDISFLSISFLAIAFLGISFLGISILGTSYLVFLFLVFLFLVFLFLLLLFLP